MSKKKKETTSSPAEALAKAFTIKKAGKPSSDSDKGKNIGEGKFPPPKKEKPTK